MPVGSTVSEIAQEFWVDMSQAAQREPWSTKHCTMMTNSFRYLYDRDFVLSGQDHLQAHGFPRGLALAPEFKDSEVRNLAGESFAVPCIVVASMVFWMNPIRTMVGPAGRGPRSLPATTMPWGQLRRQRAFHVLAFLVTGRLPLQDTSLCPCIATAACACRACFTWVSFRQRRRTNLQSLTTPHCAQRRFASSRLPRAANSVEDYSASDSLRSTVSTWFF